MTIPLGRILNLAGSSVIVLLGLAVAFLGRGRGPDLGVTRFSIGIGGLALAKRHMRDLVATWAGEDATGREAAPDLEARSP
ncbi:MAG: hypothetical protein HY556_00780 [Euryarchaeota archaeon]|nr:hypothetical protein [Euryarchaeota archaeon]